MKKRGKKKIDTIEKLAVLVADGFAEVDANFSRVDANFSGVDANFSRVDANFSGINKRLDRMEEDIKSIRAELSDIRKRIDRLEDQGANQAGYAKEIDHLLSRVSRIEKHLGIA